MLRNHLSEIFHLYRCTPFTSISCNYIQSRTGEGHKTYRTRQNQYFTKENSPMRKHEGEKKLLFRITAYFTFIILSSAFGSITRFTSQDIAFASLKAALTRISSHDAPNFTLYVPAAVSHLEADSLKEARV